MSTAERWFCIHHPVVTPADVLLLSATLPLSKKAKKVVPGLLEQEPLAGMPLLTGGASSLALASRLERANVLVGRVVPAARRVLGG